MRGVRFEQVVVDRVLVAVDEGESYRAIAGWSGVSISAISRMVHARWVREQQSCVRERRVREGSLTLRDRVQVLVGIERGESNAVIGERIGFSRSAVWAEIRRNGGRGVYDPEAAQQRCLKQALRPRESWIVTRPWLWERVQELLRKKWSPRQISSRLRKEHDNDPDWSVSHEMIYEAIFVQAKPQLRKELARCLRSGRARRVPHGRRSRSEMKPIKNMVNISERPAEADDRATPGHWEGDLIVGLKSQSYVATLVERSTRWGMLIKLENKTADHVAERISQAILRLPEQLRRSLTWDGGTELADHAKIKTTANIDVYFCDPHSPWQRGSNENWNGLVRQYLPKGTDLSIHTQAELDDIALLLNTRPRQTLDWENPAERFNKLVAITT